MSESLAKGHRFETDTETVAPDAGVWSSDRWLSPGSAVSEEPEGVAWVPMAIRRGDR